MAKLYRGEWYWREMDRAWVSSNDHRQIIRGLSKTATLAQIRAASVRGKPVIEPVGANIYGDDRLANKRRPVSLKRANALISAKKLRFKKLKV